MIFIGQSDYEKLLPKHVKFHKLTINAYFFKTFFSFFFIRKILLQKDLIDKKISSYLIFIIQMFCHYFFKKYSTFENCTF